MITITPQKPVMARNSRRLVIKASRPAIIDLRFKGDAWVIEAREGELGAEEASVCLGDYSLGKLAVSPLDLPSLNRTFALVRLGQARRNYASRIKKLNS